MLSTESEEDGAEAEGFVIDADDSASDIDAVNDPSMLPRFAKTFSSFLVWKKRSKIKTRASAVGNWLKDLFKICS